MTGFAEQLFLLLLVLIATCGAGGAGWLFRCAAIHLRSVTEHLAEIDRRVFVLETRHQAQSP